MPRRIAATKRSFGSELVRCWLSTRANANVVATDTAAQTRNTQAPPIQPSSRPAITGPMTRAPLKVTPCSASALGSSARETSPGVIAAMTGKRIAAPMPCAKVSTSSSSALMRPASVTAKSTSAISVTQTCVAISTQRRSNRSASAPAGSAIMRIGSVIALDTSATMSGEADSEVMSHAAVLSLIQEPVSAASEASQSARKPPCRSGDQALIVLNEPQFEAPGRKDLAAVEQRAARAVVALVAPEDGVLAAVASGCRFVGRKNRIADDDEAPVQRAEGGALRRPGRG